ncbi:hypothetical protein KZ770_22815 [Escherichia coli]|nr:hypothetical protein [Escherichia coli]
MNIILPIKDIFIIAGNIVFSVLYNEHLEFPCRCQLLSSNSEVMQELYIEKELFIKRTTENDCRALVLRGTLEYLFDEIIAGECALALLQKRNKKKINPICRTGQYPSFNNELRNFYLRNNATLYEVYHEVKNVNKGVGLGGEIMVSSSVIRSSNSKNTLEEFHEFFGNFKPNNSTARVEVIDQSVLEPFWRF